MNVRTAAAGAPGVAEPSGRIPGWGLRRLTVAGVFVAAAVAGAVGEVLRTIHALSDDDAYSAYAAALDLGASDVVAGIVGLSLALSLLLGSAVGGRRGDDRASFVLAIAATLAFTPIVWRHYLALLLVAVAVARPRFGPVWLVPLPMGFVSTGSGTGAAFETLATLLLVALTIAVAFHEARGRRVLRSLPRTAA